MRAQRRPLHYGPGETVPFESLGIEVPVDAIYAE